MKKSNALRNILIIAVAGIAITCICLGIILILAPSTPQTASVPISAPESTEPLQSTDPPAPTSAPAPTDTPVPIPAGDSRDNPVAAGTAVDIGGDMILTIVGAVRPANDIVEQANPFNAKPESGQEYVQVDVRVVCNKPSSEKCNFSAYNLKAVGSDGNIRDSEIFIAGVDGMIESGEFFGGATKLGKMFFVVVQGDTSAVLFYEPLFGDPIYLALPAQ